MALCVNDSGTWRDITTLCVNDSGTWREVTAGCINQSGTWRCFGMVFGPDIAGASLGDNIAGGYLICKASSIGWIAAPSSTQVTRTWYGRADAVTQANAAAACGDWFVPNVSQLQNPGSTCRAYWDNCTHYYWSNSESDSRFACYVYIPSGFSSVTFKGIPVCVRAFRCVAY